MCSGSSKIEAPGFLWMAGQAALPLRMSGIAGTGGGVLASDSYQVYFLLIHRQVLA